MDRSGQTHLSHPAFNTTTAIEMEKAGEALLKVQAKITNNPEIALYTVHQLDKRAPEKNEHSTWTTADIQTEVQKLDLEFVKPLLTPEEPTSVEEYELKIENEITKTLQKRTITHHTNPEKAQKLYLSLKNAHEAKQQRAANDWEGLTAKEQKAEKLWREAHQPGPAEQEKVIGTLGKGTYGKAESVIFGEAGPILAKKTAATTSPVAQHELRQEAENLQTFNHPNIIKVVPPILANQKWQNNTKGAGRGEASFFMQSGGQPLTSLIQGVQNNEKKEPQGVGGTQDSPDQREIAKTNLEIIKGMIKQADANAKYDDLCAEVEQIYTETSFSKRDFDESLYVINNSLKAANDPQQTESLQKLQALTEAWKLKVPPQRDSGEPLPMKEIQDISRQIFSGLSHLHEKGMVHLDIKPANVLVQPDGTVKIIDFGLSRETDDHINDPMLIGSPLLMAPEMINTQCHWEDCSEECSEASDIYSTGAMLCWLATGKHYNYAGRHRGMEDALTKLMTHAVNEKEQLQKEMFDNIDKKYPHEHEQQQAGLLKGLLSQMLEPDPENRPSAEALLKHPFFQQNGQTARG